MSASRINVSVNLTTDETFLLPDEYPALFERLANETLAAENLTGGFDIDLSILPDCVLRELNNRFRGLDKPTDVLSFPQYTDKAQISAAAPPVMLGDIIISLETAERQAYEYCHSLKRELGFLFVHGLLHLLGYDHTEGEGGRQDMFDRQDAILERIGLTRDVE